MLRLFKFTPICIKVEKYNDYVHYFKWKKIKAFSKIPEKEFNQFILHSINNKKLNTEDKKDSFLQQLLKSKQKIFFRGKYISLLKFVNRLKIKLKNLLENSLIIGEVNTRFHGTRRISLQFIDNLKGKYSFRRENDNSGVSVVRSTTQFKSIPLKEYYGYQLIFELFRTRETISPSSNNEFLEINGEFWTLLIDINEI